MQHLSLIWTWMIMQTLLKAVTFFTGAVLVSRSFGDAFAV